MGLRVVMTLASGVSLPDGYAVVICCNFKYINPISCSVKVNIYKDKDSYDLGRAEVIQLDYKCTQETFDSYFSEDVLIQDGISVLSQSYEFLKTFPQFTEYIIEDPK